MIVRHETLGCSATETHKHRITRMELNLCMRAHNAVRSHTITLMAFHVVRYHNEVISGILEVFAMNKCTSPINSIPSHSLIHSHTLHSTHKWLMCTCVCVCVYSLRVHISMFLISSSCVFFSALSFLHLDGLFSIIHT